MVFSDVIFLHWFLPLFFAVYFLTPFRGRALVIALASYLFYGWWRPDFVLLMGLSTVVDFQCGRRIEAAQSAGHRGRGWLVASLVVNLGLLGWFKYADFGIASFNAITTRLGWEPIPAMSIVLPVGISFYTFQTMSYTIDVYRREAPPAARFVDFMAYVALFPQLVAGPIVRYGTIAKELVTRRHDLPSFAEGVLFFQTGLAKKLLIADRVAPIVDAAFLQSGLSVADAWIGILAYAVQIYFDFSGYSDMAIGLGRMIGFHFPINFDSPYRATSITDFWRRWHISLSSWLRDYLYLPLGGNRRGGLFTYRNLALTMLIGGLWHGAAWNFIVWGAWHGAWLIVERATGKRALWAFLPRPLGIICTLAIVFIGWVFFRAPNAWHATEYLREMFAVSKVGGLRPLHLTTWATASLVLGLGLVAWAPPTQKLVQNRPWLWLGLLQLVFLWCLIEIQFRDDVPFLYFQF